jgi:hypothetical protein
LIDIPGFWRVSWNNLALPLADYTPMESLFCATFEDRLIYLDYGQSDGEPRYTFVYKIGSGADEHDIENVTGLSRAEGYAKLAYWLITKPPGA